MNFGFKPDIITDDNYVLGGNKLPKIVLQPDGDWSKYLPEYEPQSKRGIETQNCTSFGTLSAIEMMKRRIYKKTVNYSDRFLGIVADTNPLNGNTPHTVCEAIRKNGLVKESDLPFDDKIKSPKDYYQPKPPPDSLIQKGLKWLKLYDFGHEWVFTPTTAPDNKVEAIKEALKYSPLGVSVYAWRELSGLYYKPLGAEDNHWCVLYKVNDDGTYQIFDTYDGGIKTLERGYNFWFCKRYHLTENVYGADNYEDKVSGILATLKSILSLLVAFRDKLLKDNEQIA